MDAPLVAMVILGAAAFVISCGGHEPARSDASTHLGLDAGPLCGDGRQDPGEECDEGPLNSNTSPDACRSNCRMARCGDGAVDTGEVCDDGNITDGDGCAANCLSDETCGNGILDPQELCDDGNTDGGDGCAADCQSDETCGNGIWDLAAGEECDDGIANSDTEPDACRSDCGDPMCGDGVIDVALGETCDHGGTPDLSCSPDCRQISCGDGVVDLGEVCDDGNNVGGDGCAAGCQSDETCGNGVADTLAGEQCDDGAANSDVTPNACRLSCHWPSCGDGVVDPALGEGCDDGPLNSDTTPDACRTYCSPARCGDDVIDPGLGEQCDGATLGGASCASVAGLPSGSLGCSGSCAFDTSPCFQCGDGIVQPSEGCDDGNILAGDGCSSVCQVEDFYHCSSEPSACVCAVIVTKEWSTPVEDGKSWSSGFFHIYEGIDTAISLGPECEVWLKGVSMTVWGESSQQTLFLRDGIRIYGGFAGTETSRSQRDPVATPTTITGRAVGAINPWTDRVISAGAITALLDGVTVVKSSNSAAGGGLTITGDANITLRNVIFSQHSASRGSAIYATSTGQPILTIDGCTFQNNGTDAVVYHAGSPITGTPGLVIRDSLFTNNAAASALVIEGNGHLERVTFLDNSGRAIRIGNGSPAADVDILDTLIAGNTADVGGGLYVDPGATATLIGCTLANNTVTTDASAIYAEGDLELVNSIVWGSGAGALTLLGAVSVSYCDVEGGVVGPTNIDLDPLFIDPASGSFRLAVGSPAIDAGDDTRSSPTDLDGNPRVDQPAVGTPGVLTDLGSYEAP